MLRKDLRRDAKDSWIAPPRLSGTRKFVLHLPEFVIYCDNSRETFQPVEALMPSKPPAVSETGDPLLLTPGPLTTSRRVKEVMVHDWGSRDATFLRINSEVLTRLPEIVNGAGDYVTVPMQGSGTFAVEAMLTSFVPPKGKVLLLVNGAYGHRAKKISGGREAQDGRARDARGYPARPRGGRTCAQAHVLDHATSSRSTARPPRACSIRSWRSARWRANTASNSCSTR